MIRGHFDGASRGNPGKAGAGAVVYEDEKVVWLRAEPLGQMTNNEAEYTALSLLLDELERRGAQGAEICGDSKLVISQVTGAWKIKEPRLRALAEPLIERVRALGAHISPTVISATMRRFCRLTTPVIPARRAGSSEGNSSPT